MGEGADTRRRCVRLGEFNQTRVQFNADGAGGTICRRDNHPTVARTEVETEARADQGFLGLHVRHFSHSDETVYDQRFEVLWDQTRNGAPMNFGDQGVFRHGV